MLVLSIFENLYKTRLSLLIEKSHNYNGPQLKFDKRCKEINLNKKEKMAMVRQSYHLIPSTDTDDQRILEPHWTKRTTGHTQPKMVASHSTFP